MPATTEPKRQPTHVSSGGDHRKKSYSWILIGGIVFLAAWAVWTFFFASALPA